MRTLLSYTGLVLYVVSIVALRRRILTVCLRKEKTSHRELDFRLDSRFLLRNYNPKINDGIE